MKIIETCWMRTAAKNQKVPFCMHCSCVIKSWCRGCLPMKSTKRGSKSLFHQNLVAVRNVNKHTYMVSTSSHAIVSKSRMKRSFSSRLLKLSPPNIISLEPTRATDCPSRATWNRSNANHIQCCPLGCAWLLAMLLPKWQGVKSTTLSMKMDTTPSLYLKGNMTHS